jgi:UDP:flavonoid glycosyltransferase YjiC (YdhE family)
MQAVRDAGAGVMLRADTLSEARLRRAIRQVQAPSHAEAARRLQADGARHDPIAGFEALITALQQTAGRAL